MKSFILFLSSDLYFAGLGAAGVDWPKDATAFDTEDAARAFADENDLSNVAVETFTEQEIAAMGNE